MLAVVRADPRQRGHDQSRWTIVALQAELGWLRHLTRFGISRLFRRIGVVFKRGRGTVHSPDPDYEAKVARRAELLAVAETDPTIEVLCLDEVTYYRQPTVSRGWEEVGAAHQPRAEGAATSNPSTRVVGALNVRDGRVHFLRRTVIHPATLVVFFWLLVKAYPGKTIYVLLDNWPIHFHPEVLVALEPQTSPFPIYRPRHWPTEPNEKVARRWEKRRALPVQLVPLPTYAPWTNPIEKLWRWLRAEVIHHHRHAGDLDALRAEADAFLKDFADGSEDLLRYVGLGMAA